MSIEQLNREPEELGDSGESEERAPILLTVPPEATGERLDLFLVRRFSEASRSAFQRAVSTGDITVNRATVKPSYRLSAGETIQAVIPTSAPLEAAPEEIPLDIVYEDDELIVVNKPAGMVTHPGAGARSGTLANALVFHLMQTAGALPRRGGASRPGIVHRLDVGTSGLLVAAKTDRAHLSLAVQFEARTVFKSYTALVYGVVKEEQGRIDAPIERDPRNRVRMSVATRAEAGRPAVTLYRVAQRFAAFTLLEVEIKTGRTHQIRVHLAHVKHPVIGDPTYDGGRANSVQDVRLRAAVNRLHRPFLHAARLSFDHPTTGQRLDFSAPLPPELSTFLTTMAAQAKT